jgi:prepilin-type N-terminal cleavage/methylation domain-containing protein
MKKFKGFTLTELLISLLIASSMSLAGIQWFQMTTETVVAQRAFMDGNEAGRFTVRYLSDQIQQAGLGVKNGIGVSKQSDSDVLIVQYSAISPDGRELLNCLGNGTNTSDFSDEFRIETYDEGGRELKCSSENSADWISENIKSMRFILGVDQGRFINNEFIYGEFDRKIDAYIASDDFSSERMNVLAVKVIISTYRPSELSMFSRVFWSQKVQGSESDVSREFQTTIFLPNT